MQSPYKSSHLLNVLAAFRQLVFATNRWDDLSMTNKAQESLLRKRTKLPMAGDVNVEYVTFLDDVAEGWRRSGAGPNGAQEVVDVSDHG